MKNHPKIIDRILQAVSVSRTLCVVGHIRPVFLGFGKGGKGVATACGVFLALAPLQALLSLLIFAVVVLASGYVSLASLTAAFSLPVLLAASSGVRSPLFSVAVLTFAFVGKGAPARSIAYDWSGAKE